jgi:predicted metalloendopeptidase
MKRVNLIMVQVDGKETLGENMADGGGIKMAYRVRFHS